MPSDGLCSSSWCGDDQSYLSHVAYEIKHGLSCVDAVTKIKSECSAQGPPSSLHCQKCDPATVCSGAPGAYGELCGTDPATPCEYELSCADTGLCLCTDASQWGLCGPGKVCT